MFTKHCFSNIIRVLDEAPYKKWKVIMKMTMEEIARLAGVSKATVSRVLNGKSEGVGEKTRIKVQQVLDQVGYEKDRTLSFTAKRGYGSIGLIVPDITNPFFSDIARAVENHARESNYFVILANTDFSQETERRYIANFLAKKVDGIILIPSGSHSGEEHRLPEKYGIPMLLLDRRFVDERDWIGCYSDNAYAAFHACTIMYQHGARNIAYLTGGSAVSTSLERLEGYKTALEYYNLPQSPELIQNGNYTVESGYDAVVALEKANVNYNGILAANDLMALGAIRALREFSYRIPEDVEVIGFDNIPFAVYCDPPLTTIQQPTSMMGRKACEMVFQMIQGKKIQESITLYPKIVVRKTTKNEVLIHEKDPGSRELQHGPGSSGGGYAAQR